ncbi:MAG: sulfatase [Luteolibacter sp.]
MKNLTLLAALLVPALNLHAAEERPAKPNILLLLTDDLGWQDLKCYDIDEPSPMETPHLDAFAKKGVMFWQGYSPAPTCAPSRCAILSGNHPARAHKTHVVGGHPPLPRSDRSRIMEPWYSGRIPADELTIARLLKQNGYTTGHSGKWHMAIDHKAFPQPKDVGFDYTRSSRGSRRRMEDRLTDFATTDPKDPFHLDKNGYPFDQTNEDAIAFMNENADKPFFLYYATWLVHSPIHTRSEERLKKYAEKTGSDPAQPPTTDTPGQLNPFYAAMVEELDYYVGQVFNYLETTEDPRWPGHMLSENTYVIFTSDNGGMEGGSGERYTENAPLDRGKISAREGGTRVPLIIAGPGIPAGVQTDVMANGLDFYPTILSMTGVEKPKDKNLDGLNLLPLLTGDPKDPSLVKEADGATRDTLMWHFPHGGAMESTLRVGDFKLIRKYDPVTSPLELFRLYDSTSGEPKRVDIEEAKNLVKSMPEKAQEMNSKLTEILTGMKATYPGLNPDFQGELAHKDQVPTVTNAKLDGKTLTITFQENGAKVTSADLIYTLNSGQQYEEWFRAPMALAGNTATLELPEDTTHYIFNLTDENHFLTSYPEMKPSKEYRSANSYTSSAIKAP